MLGHSTYVQIPNSQWVQAHTLKTGDTIVSPGSQQPTQITSITEYKGQSVAIKSNQFYNWSLIDLTSSVIYKNQDYLPRDLPEDADIFTKTSKLYTKKVTVSSKLVSNIGYTLGIAYCFTVNGRRRHFAPTSQYVSSNRVVEDLDIEYQHLMDVLGFPKRDIHSPPALIDNSLYSEGVLDGILSGLRYLKYDNPRVVTSPKKSQADVPWINVGMYHYLSLLNTKLYTSNITFDKSDVIMIPKPKPCIKKIFSSTETPLLDIQTEANEGVIAGGFNIKSYRPLQQITFDW